MSNGGEDAIEKWRDITTTSEVIKEEIRQARSSKKNPHPINAPLKDKRDAEFKLQFQNLEQKREIRFLTKTIEEMQTQLAAAKKKNKHLSDTLEVKLANGEVVTNQKGVKYTFVTTSRENELNNEIKKHEEALLIANKENSKLRATISEVEDDLASTERRLDIEKEAGFEKDKLIDNLKLQIETLEKLLKDTEMKMKNENEKTEKQIEELIMEKDEANTKIDELENDINSLEIHLNDNEKEIEKLSNISRDLEKIIETKSQEINKVCDEGGALKQQIEDLKMALEKEEKEKQEYKEWLVELKVREEKMLEEKDKKLQDKVQEIKMKGEQEKILKTRIKKLEKDLERLAPKQRWK